MQFISWVELHFTGWSLRLTPEQFPILRHFLQRVSEHQLFDVIVEELLELLPRFPQTVIKCIWSLLQDLDTVIQLLHINIL